MQWSGCADGADIPVCRNLTNRVICPARSQTSKFPGGETVRRPRWRVARTVAFLAGFEEPVVAQRGKFPRCNGALDTGMHISAAKSYVSTSAHFFSIASNSWRCVAETRLRFGIARSFSIRVWASSMMVGLPNDSHFPRWRRLKT